MSPCQYGLATLMNCFKAESDKVGGRLRRVFGVFKGALALGASEVGVDMKVGGCANAAKKASAVSVRQLLILPGQATRKAV